MLLDIGAFEVVYTPIKGQLPHLLPRIILDEFGGLKSAGIGFDFLGAALALWAYCGVTVLCPQRLSGAVGSQLFQVDRKTGFDLTVKVSPQWEGASTLMTWLVFSISIRHAGKLNRRASTSFLGGVSIPCFWPVFGGHRYDQLPPPKRVSTHSLFGWHPISTH
jgi:hypothetical protein